MSNVFTLHAEKRWKAVIEYDTANGPITIDHYFEEIRDLHEIIERGPDYKSLSRCTVTLNRPDGGEARERMVQSRQGEMN